MIATIRYTIYLIVILLCLFFLQRVGVDVKGGFWKAIDNISAFSKSVINDPEEKDNLVIDDILKQDMIGGLTGSTTVVKSYISSPTNAQPVIRPSQGMSIAGVLRYTNEARVANGLKPLTINTKLSDSAEAKIDDMFMKQYFEHISPTGQSAADLVRAEGYNFQAVGENLALGDFDGDKKLVDAWMNSPSHRKNILNEKFTEIGLAVAKGTYKGERQWLAVQHFGKLAPVCDTVSVSIKNNIDTEKADLEIEEKNLKELANEIENDPNQNKGQEFLDMYNDRVSQYNTRLGLLRDLIKDYNVRIDAYNACLAS